MQITKKKLRIIIVVLLMLIVVINGIVTSPNTIHKYVWAGIAIIVIIIEAKEWIEDKGIK